MLFGSVTYRKGHFVCHTHAIWQGFMHPGGLIFWAIFPKRLIVQHVQAACKKINHSRRDVWELPTCETESLGSLCYFQMVFCQKTTTLYTSVSIIKLKWELHGTDITCFWVVSERRFHICLVHMFDMVTLR